MINSKNLTLSNNEKLGLIGNFATMLSAGISILEIIDSLSEDAKGNQKKILQILKEDIIEGKRLYLAFSNFPKVFDQVTINLIKASEEAGTLESTLKDLKTSLKKEMEFGDKIKSALIYPLVIMVVFFGVLLMMLIVVIPKIATVFSRLKVVLPLPTKILIFVSDLLLNQTIPFTIGLLSLILIIFLVYKTNKKLIFGFCFSLPLISRLIKEIDVTRFTRSMYFLLTSGVAITTALELAENVVLRSDVARVIKNSKELVISGKKLSEGLKKAKGIFPAIVIRIIEAGEKSGSLDQSMLEISDFLDYQVSGTLRTITVLIEPIMLVLVGILVGGMMLAIIAPIYGLIGQVGVR